MDGQGKYTMANGDIYVGEWLDNNMSTLRGGQGTKTGEDSHSRRDVIIYVGQFEAGTKHGKGTERYASGDSYEGQIRLGKRGGEGTYTYADGSIKKRPLEGRRLCG